jgi:hypothetical protein
LPSLCFRAPSQTWPLRLEPKENRRATTEGVPPIASNDKAFPSWVHVRGRLRARYHRLARATARLLVQNHDWPSRSLRSIA